MNYSRLIPLFAVLPLAACELDVPDLNNPGEGELRENPTPELVAAATTGLLVGSRDGIAENNGYIAHLSVIGREAYNFDAADPRFRSELMSDTCPSEWSTNFREASGSVC